MADLDPDRFTLRQAAQARDDFAQVMDELDFVKELLGRANCQEFLSSNFLLHEDNPVFESAWTPAQKQALGKDVRGGRYLPIIPLLDNASVPESLDPWPRHLLNPAIYRAEVERRFRRIAEFEGRSGILSSAVTLIIAHLGEGKVGDLVVNAMNKALTDAGLN